MSTRDSPSSDLLNTVSCPACGESVEMGLPRSVTVEAVTAEVDADLDEAYLPESQRRKRRATRCENDHLFYVYFEY